ncbi:MAG TPA: ATP-binding protein [Thermomicrobiales bacterium]|nr:ATP-binding protein [Thermomicrobiales bacterium]
MSEPDPESDIETEIERLRRENELLRRELAARDGGLLQAGGMALLAEGSRIFAETLDREQTLEAVARHLATTLGDACLIWLLTDDGEWRRLVAIDHRDPERLARMRSHLPDDPRHPARGWSLLDGQTDIYPVVPAEDLPLRIWEPLLPYAREHPVHSIIAAPLRVRGRVIGAIRLSRDITPRSYTHDDLLLVEELADHAALAIDNARLYGQARDAQAMYRGLFEGVPDAIVVVDDTGQYRDVNAAAETLFGYSRQELLSFRAGGMTEAAGVPEARSHDFFASLRHDGYWRGESEVRRGDGSIIPVEGHATAVELPEGRMYIAVSRDVSERRALERMQQEFISMVTHELKIPLTTMRGFVQLMLRRKQLSEPALRTMLAQADRLERLINDLLDSARLEAGRLEIVPERVDLIALARETAQAEVQLSPTHTIRVLAPETRVVGRWDAGRLEQVFENLLTNAIKYSPDGSEVIVRIEVSGAEAIVTVTDQGSGIPPEQLPHLFSRFTRLHAAAASGTPGLGLGLYIARSLVEAHRGRIWVESEVGSGSTFGFALPLEYPLSS